MGNVSQKDSPEKGSPLLAEETNAIDYVLMTAESPCIFFEGDSDVEFYKNFIASGDLVCGRFPDGGKDSVKEGILHYNAALQKNDKYRKPYPKHKFCIDHDYDGYTCERKFSEEFVFYQMWDKKTNTEKDCCNDLESFLATTSLMDCLLQDEFGLDEKTANAYKQQVIEAAKFVGCYRAASRSAQKAQPPEKRSYPVLYRWNARKRCSEEIDVEFFVTQGILSFGKGKIGIDVSRVEDVIKNCCSKSGKGLSEDNLVNQALMEAKKIYKLNGFNLCRGHDIPEILWHLLSASGAYSKTFRSQYKSTDVEHALTFSPKKAEDRKRLLEAASKYPIYSLFSKKLMNQFLTSGFKSPEE